MPNQPNKNPLRQLIRVLPKELAHQKRQAIRADLEAIGKWQHYRQCVSRVGWEMPRTQIACAAILMQHLGLSLTFFTGTDEERDREVERLARESYQHVLANLSPFTSA